MTDKPDVPTLVRCPSCRKSVRYDKTNEFRPFCSARCKNADIAAWADEAYRIASDKRDHDGDPEGHDEDEDV